MWSNAISVRTSAMNSSRQPKISFKISWWSVLVANAESCEYVVHSSCVNFCSKISLVPKYICLDIYITFIFTHTVSVPCI